MCVSVGTVIHVICHEYISCTPDKTIEFISNSRERTKDRSEIDSLFSVFVFAVGHFSTIHNSNTVGNRNSISISNCPYTHTETLQGGKCNFPFGRAYPHGWKRDEQVQRDGQM